MPTINEKIAASRNLPHIQAREILREAYKRLFNKEPSDGELNFGLATAFFETGYGRAGGQFAKWASQGLYNWGALESGIPGPESTFNKFRSAGLNPVKKQGQDAGRSVYFYLFPTDIDAAQAFLMSWGRPDTLKAAATNSPQAVAASMKNHGYYEGFWVPPGNPQGRKMPPFKEASSKEEAERNNIRDYASALNGHVAAVTNTKPQPLALTNEISKSPDGTAVSFWDKLKRLLMRFISASEQRQNFLITVGSSPNRYAKMEYARILSSALEDYLDAKTTICADVNDNIEIECHLNDYNTLSEDAIKELSESISDVFKTAAKTTNHFVLVREGSKSNFPILHPSRADRYARIFKLQLKRAK